jgi:hypothetical protein
MRKMALRTATLSVAVIALYLCYEVYAHAMHAKAVKAALARCSARTTVVLSHTEFDPSTLSKTLRNISEAIDYVDGVATDVHIHDDGSVHFRDEKSFRYLKLCGDTLRTERSFAEAAQELSSLAIHAGGSGLDAQGSTPHELAYDELVRRHSALREMLTELQNENKEMASTTLADVLVDIGAVESAQRMVELYYSSAK